MKKVITSEDYKQYYNAGNWDPIIFEKLLKHLGYDYGNLTVDDHLDLRRSKITHLVGVKEVKGDLLLRNSDVISLGDLRAVHGDLSMDNTPLESLGDLDYVGGNLFISPPLYGIYSVDDIMDKTHIHDWTRIYLV